MPFAIVLAEIGNRNHDLHLLRVSGVFPQIKSTEFCQVLNGKKFRGCKQQKMDKCIRIYHISSIKSI